MSSIAVIGAGVAGLTLARELRTFANVTVFDKGRGVGGRMATRYEDSFEFDHGAQYFTCRSTSMKEVVSRALDAGEAACWTPRVTTLEPGARSYGRPWFEPHFVGAPRMNRFPRFLARGTDVQSGVEIRSLERERAGWRLVDADGNRHGPFERVVSTAPAPQTARLLPPEFADRSVIESVRMLPCFTLMAGFESAPNTGWQAAVVKSSPIGWIAVNSSKPGRASPWTLVAHSTNAWAVERETTPSAEATAILGEALRDVSGVDTQDARVVAGHRWRYAYAETPANRPYFFDRRLGLAACGDWCLGPRVEAAFSSAMQLAAAWRGR